MPGCVTNRDLASGSRRNENCGISLPATFSLTSIGSALDPIRRNGALNTLALLAFCFGALSLLLFGATRGILSPREFGIGLLAFLVGFPVLVWYLAKRRTKKYRLSCTDSPPAIDDKARRRITSRILRNKIWIGVLAVCLPVGVAMGITERAWLPTVAGVAINQFLIYASILEIKRLRRVLN